MKKLIVAITVALALAATPAFSKKIYNHNGGKIFDIAIEFSKYKRIEIMGRCASACTLAVNKACAGPNAWLGVHSPSGVDARLTQVARGMILNRYRSKPKFAQAVMRDRALYRSEVTWYRARDFLPPC